MLAGSPLNPLSIDPWNTPDSDGEGAEEGGAGLGVGPQPPNYDARLAVEKARDSVIALQQPPQAFSSHDDGSGQGLGLGQGLDGGSVNVIEDRIRGRLQEAKALSALALMGGGSQVGTPLYTTTHPLTTFTHTPPSPNIPIHHITPTLLFPTTISPPAPPFLQPLSHPTPVISLPLGGGYRGVCPCSPTSVKRGTTARQQQHLPQIGPAVHPTPPPSSPRPRAVPFPQ